VRLRGYEKSDLDAVMKWWHDEEVTKFISAAVFPAYSLQKKRFIENVASGRDSLNKEFAIETLADRKYIGTIGLHNIDWLSRHAKLAIVIGDKEYWDRGYGTEAVKVLLRLAFERMGRHRVELVVVTFNQRAIACYEKCGFRREGILRDFVFKLGAFQDVVMMSILANEFQRRNEERVTNSDG
jgi:RimJ/RimL family protein N-acetyltransferase